MKCVKLTTAAWLMVILLFAQLPAQLKDAPAPIAAALLVKVIPFEKTIGTGEITVYVLGSPDLATEMKKAIGQANIKNVLSGNNLPATKPSILFIGDESKMNAALEYTHKNKILSATSLPDLVAKGITLGFGIGTDNKPKILLNLNASVEEGLDWNPAIMKVAQIIK